jgi:cytochrome c556
MELKNAFFTLCVCAAIIVVPAQADEFDSEVKARQAFMQILAYNNGILASMVRGKAPYDAEIAKVAARNVNLAASMNNASMWPAGSDMTSHEESVAKKDIWTTWPKAGDIFSELSLAAMNLENEAGKGLDALKTAIDPVGEACSSCHKQFREKR